MGTENMFRAAARRLSGEEFAELLIITGADFRFIVAEQLEAIGIKDSAILIEPAARNTAPAVLAAALYLADRDPDGMMLIAPSDHVILDTQAFVNAVKEGQCEAERGKLVTFGIKPNRPETGYGYLQLPHTAADGVQPLERFVEKPDLEHAEQMLKAGNYLWNAGIFLFSIKAIMEAFQIHAPSLIEPVRKAMQAGRPDLSFFRIASDHWMDVEDISIDYAVMEKASNLSVVPFNGFWSDLGGWDAVWRESKQDTAGNALSGKAMQIDCKDSLLRSESDDLELVGIGLKDTVVVATRDAVLVADKSRAQDIKTVVRRLKEKGAAQAESFPHDHRPWGWFETLALSDRFQVKRIVVKPGASLSLQSHVHRSEHWIVVSGTAKVTIDNKIKLLTENESVYVPLGAVHRLENPGKVPMILIEVQTGSYLGEDDIIRYEDAYDRT